MREAAWERLLDRCVAVAQERPSLLRYTPLPEPGEEVLTAEELARARLGAIVVEALLSISAEIHPVGDRALVGGAPIWREEAVVLVKEAGNLRRAESIYGIPRSVLHRALQQKGAAQ